jgi:hypothetical protein
LGSGVTQLLLGLPEGAVGISRNSTYEKVVFDSWRQVTFDVNDTVALNGSETGDPRTDLHIKGFVAEHVKALPISWETWSSASRTRTRAGCRSGA